MNDKFSKIIEKFKTLELQIQEPTLVLDQNKYAKVTQEYSEIKEIYDLIIKYNKIEKVIKDNKEIANSSDPDLSKMASDELPFLVEKKDKILTQINEELRPKDPNDKKNIILEIRAGTGGDESSLFAADLFRMYSNYAELMRWNITIISTNETELGGYKELIAEITGSNVYKYLKYESGAHRVQRVPETEKQGRIHTSTATVAVIPEAEEIDVYVDPKELRIDKYHASGAGGQHVNKTESAIRITHIPTGLVVVSQDQRSQQQNKTKAMQVILSRIQQHREEEALKKQGVQRKAMVGTGDRSEKIRTYNYPQDRITDHRIKESWNNISTILDGNLSPIIKKLQEEEKTLQDKS